MRRYKYLIHLLLSISWGVHKSFINEEISIDKFRHLTVTKQLPSSIQKIRILIFFYIKPFRANHLIGTH